VQALQKKTRVRLQVSAHAARETAR